jgi:hypothetical protein
MDNQIVLDAAELRRRGVLRPGSRTRGLMTWVDETGRTTASVAYVADLVDAREVRLLFSIADVSGARKHIEQRLGVAVTRVGFGDRLWFAIDGRRAARVALAPGNERFELLSLAKLSQVEAAGRGS